VISRRFLLPLLLLFPGLAIGQIVDLQNVLATIQHFEDVSGDPAALNYRYDAQHTASGLYQINISTWNPIAAQNELARGGSGNRLRQRRGPARGSANPRRDRSLCGARLSAVDLLQCAIGGVRERERRRLGVWDQWH